MSAEEFLHSTPPEINWKIEAYNQAKEDQIARDWQLGQLISFAYNDPKKYPKLKSLLPKKVSAEHEAKINREFRKQGAAIGMRVP